VLINKCSVSKKAPFNIKHSPGYRFILRKRKWNWLVHTLRRIDNSIIQPAPQGHHKATEENGDPRIRGKMIRGQIFKKSYDKLKKNL